MDLLQALRLGPRFPVSPISIAFVGAGGKSTAIFSLARLLSGKARHPILVTATSHLHVDQVKLADSHWIISDSASLGSLEENPRGVILVTGPLEADRTTAIDPETLSLLHDFSGARDIPLLIEADGSRRHPLKAPAAHEPPIPPFVRTVLVVAGLSALGRPLTAEFVHRPELFSDLSGLPPGADITPAAILGVLTHLSGGLKNIPASARRLVLLTQADTPAIQSLAGSLAEKLLLAYDAVLIASLDQPSPVHAVVEPVAGIILAAGGSSRFGSPKQLQKFDGETFVHRVARTALSAGLNPVVVVTGAAADQVRASVSDLPVQVVRNDAWESGQSSSIRLGLQSLPRATAAAAFLLSDQPQLSPAVLRALVEQHSLDLAPILAPFVEGQRANPVLFDQVTFPALLQLTGDVGGRAIFSKYPPRYLPWHDGSLLLDVDTPADLKKIQAQE